MIATKVPALTHVVDCYGNVHLVCEREYRDGKPVLQTYYKSGKLIAEYPPSMRYRAAKIQRDSIASVAVRLVKWTPLDAKIAKRFKNCRSMSAF